MIVGLAALLGLAPGFAPHAYADNRHAASAGRLDLEHSPVPVISLYEAVAGKTGGPGEISGLRYEDPYPSLSRADAEDSGPGQKKIYDAQGRLVEIRIRDDAGQETERRFYDAGENLRETWFLSYVEQSLSKITKKDAGGIIRFEYYYRPGSEHTGDYAEVWFYAYDGNHLKQIKKYNASNRLTHIYDYHGANTADPARYTGFWLFDYDAAGDLKQILKYDRDSRLQSGFRYDPQAQSWDDYAQKTSVAYDASGKKISEDTYSYDASGQAVGRSFRRYDSGGQETQWIREVYAKQALVSYEDFRYATGQMKRRYYRTYNPHGLLTYQRDESYFSTDRAALINETSFKDGLRWQGRARIYDDDGSLRKVYSVRYQDPRNVLNVRNFGAAGDGMANDAYAFQAAQAAAAKIGRSEIFVPNTDAGYLIGTGTQDGITTSIRPAGHTAWTSDYALLIHGAWSKDAGPLLFDVRDVADVEISGFRIDGGGEARNGVGMRGVVEDIRLSNLEFFDHAGYAIVYEDGNEDPGRARFENLVLDRVRILGKTGPDGTGSGIYLSSRSRLYGDVPASRGLYLRMLNVDIARGETDFRKHGPQGLTLHNVRDVVLEYSVFLGGARAGVVFSDDVRHALVRNVETGYSRRGLDLGTEAGQPAAVSSNVRVEGYWHRPS